MKTLPFAPFRWFVLFLGVASLPLSPSQAADVSGREFDFAIFRHSADLFTRGRHIFRYDTFGDEAFWGDALKLHLSVAGEANGGVGPGLSPAAALGVGLKVDAEALPRSLQKDLRAGKVDLESPATTLALLKLNSVVGVTGFFNKEGRLTSMGIQCALCHSTVDNSFAPGIGRRLDGWPNRDLNVGAIIALSADLSPLTDALGVDAETVRTVLHSWGPGKFDASLLLDGKAFTEDNKPAATLLPAAFGLAGVNLHTYEGWGSVPHWNAFVANLEMGGKGTLYDPRLADAETFPLAAARGAWNVRNTPDLITSKLGALHFYQLALPSPRPPRGSYNHWAARRGKKLFEGKAQCANCHVPPLFTEPGWNLHTPEEIGIDAFQADRGPEGRYRTTPLGGLFTREKGGFYHDGRFATYGDVVNHYDSFLETNLTPPEKADLVEYLKSL
jgi:hypothetical protein